MGFKKIALTGAIALGTVASLSAADSLHMKFPQAKQYGTMPQGSARAHRDVINKYYDRYVSKWYKDAGYVSSPDTHGNGATVSEAHGYGMMIFAIMGDREKFDKMAAYHMDHLAVGNLMNWTVDGDWKDGSATDGDLDMAYAYLLAAKQWNSDTYKNKAKAIIKDIYDNDMNNTGSFLALGSKYTDRELTRPSDWMAGHLRAFDGVDDLSDADWGTVIDQIYIRYNSFQGGNGLISDFVKNNQPADGGETTKDKYYFTNAGRVPMRFAMDYARHKNSANTAALKKISDRLIELCGGNATDLKAGYKFDGTALSEYNGLEFLAPYGASLIVNDDRNLINSAWNELQQDWTVSDKDITSFGDALRILSMLVMTGNWWTYTDFDTHVPDTVITTGVILDNFGNSYGDGNAQCDLGAVNGVAWGDNEFGGKSGDTTYYKGGGYWYAYSGEGARVKSAAGDVIGDGNTDDIVKDNRLDVIFEADSGDKKSYDYAALEVPFISTIKKDADSTIAEARYVSLENLTDITIKYQSSAELSVVIGTKDERDRVPADDDGWIGAYKLRLPKQEEMKQVTFPVADIIPEPGSPLEDSVKAGWSELTGLKEAIAFAFMLGENADKGAKVTLQVEDIILVGTEYKRDFDVDYRPAGVISSSNLVKKSAFNSVVTSKGITLNFTANKAVAANAALYTLTGKKVANIETKAVAGLNSVNFSNRDLANGLYVVRLQVGNNVSTARVNLVK